VPASAGPITLPFYPGQPFVNGVQPGAGANQDPDLMFDFEVVDAVVIADAGAVATQTVSIRNGGTAIFDATLACGTAGAIARPTTRASAQARFTPKSSGIASYNASPLQLVFATGATQGQVTVQLYLKRTA
jgi:hypothetical protein